MNKRKLAAVGVLLAVGGGLALARRPARADVPDDDDDDDGADDDGPPEAPPPPPPAGKKKNYVGSGWVWPHRDEFANERAFGIALQQLGYGAINPAVAVFSVLTSENMTVVRQFQRDYNKVRTAQTVQTPPPAIGTDGLIGKATIQAIRDAKRWSILLGLGWPDLVGLA